MVNFVFLKFPIFYRAWKYAVNTNLRFHDRFFSVCRLSILKIKVDIFLKREKIAEILTLEAAELEAELVVEK